MARPLAVITGASSGIGTAFAEVLAERGCDCVLAARRKERLEALAETLRTSHDIDVTVVAVDLGTPDGPRELHEAVQALGRPAAWLVNNAGFGVYGAFHESDYARVQAMMALNMGAVTELTHRFLPEMIEAGTGRIIQVASVGAFQPSPLYAVYSATKSYVRDFSEAVDYEVRGRGVRVSTVCPGLTESEFHEKADHIKPGYMNAVMMSARSVAEIAVRRADRGVPHVTPGLFNWLSYWAIKLTPRRIATAAAGRLMS